MIAKGETVCEPQINCIESHAMATLPVSRLLPYGCGRRVPFLENMVWRGSNPVLGTDKPCVLHRNLQIPKPTEEVSGT